MVEPKLHMRGAVTPQMIRAGFSVLVESGIADEYGAADRLLVEKIFRAMYLRAPHCVSRAFSGETQTLSETRPQNDISP